MIKSRSTRFLAVLAVYSLLFCLFPALPTRAATMQVPKGMELKVKFVTEAKLASDKVAKDAPLLITLVEPVVIGGITLVEAGAQGNAKVVEANKAGTDDKPGYIKIEFIDLEPKGAYKSPTGAKIKLTGSVEGTGKKKKKMLLLSGKTQGVIDAKAIHIAKVAESTILESK